MGGGLGAGIVVNSPAGPRMRTTGALRFVKLMMELDIRSEEWYTS